MECMGELYKPDHMRDKRYPKDYEKEFLEEIAATTTTVHGVTIPVNIKIEADQKVIDYGSMLEILQKASRYVIRDCPCRSTFMNNCDAPIDVCIHLDDYGDKSVEAKEYNARYVSYEDALDSVKRAQEAGLVLMAYTKKDDSYPKAICGCCACCCGYFSGMLRFGLPFPFHLVTSDRIASYSDEECSACGTCVDRCNFDAREVVDGKLLYHSERCYGCGICTTTCPTKSIKMILRN